MTCGTRTRKLVVSSCVRRLAQTVQRNTSVIVTTERRDWVILLVGSVLSLSGIATCRPTHRQGRSDGGRYIGIHTPKSVGLTVLFTCGTLTHVLKLQWLVKTYTPQIKFLRHCSQAAMSNYCWYLHVLKHLLLLLLFFFLICAWYYYYYCCCCCCCILKQKGVMQTNRFADV